MISLFVLALAGLATGCDRERVIQNPDASSPDFWTQPPRIVTVERSSNGVLIRGEGQPDGRMVLRAADGEAYAVSADGAGRFDLRLPMPGAFLFLTPQAQIGQAQAPAPERLLVIRDGPVVLLTPGAAARRLDEGPTLGAVDSDGATVLISGRAAPGGSVRVLAAGSSTTLEAGRDGRWMRATPAFDGPVIVDGRRFDWPGPGPAAVGLVEVVRAGDGWRATWPVEGGGLQSTWLPDR